MSTIVDLMEEMMHGLSRQELGAMSENSILDVYSHRQPNSYILFLVLWETLKYSTLIRRIDKIQRTAPELVTWTRKRTSLPFYGQEEKLFGASTSKHSSAFKARRNFVVLVLKLVDINMFCSFQDTYLRIYDFLMLLDDQNLMSFSTQDAHLQRYGNLKFFERGSYFSPKNK